MVKKTIKKKTKTYSDYIQKGTFVFVPNGDKPLCLLCNEVVALPKANSLQQRFDTRQGAKNANVNHQGKQQLQAACAPDTIRSQVLTAKR